MKLISEWLLVVFGICIGPCAEPPKRDIDPEHIIYRLLEEERRESLGGGHGHCEQARECKLTTVTESQRRPIDVYGNGLNATCKNMSMLLKTRFVSAVPLYG